MLLTMINLLRKGGHDHWVKWFQESYDFYSAGKAKESYEKALRAYGGMGSFNDVFGIYPKKNLTRLKLLKGTSGSTPRAIVRR